MNGIRFFEEYENKRRGVSQGNCVAVLVANGSWRNASERTYDAIGAVTYEKNGPVCGTSVTVGYLRAHCKRVSEARARQIHPRLFQYLDRQ